MFRVWKKAFRPVRGQGLETVLIALGLSLERTLAISSMQD